MLHELSRQEEEALTALARRQREAEAGEAKLLQKYSNRAVLAKQVWTLIAAFTMSIIGGTAFVLKQQTAIERVAAENVQLLTQINQLRADGTSERQQIRADISDAMRQVHQLQLEMKDKAQRP